MEFGNNMDIFIDRFIVSSEKQAGKGICLVFSLLIMLLPIVDTTSNSFFPWYTGPAAGLTMCVIGFFWIARVEKPINHLLKYLRLFLSPYLIHLFFSLLMWLIDMADSDVIWYGTKEYIKIFIGVFAAVIASEVMGKNTSRFVLLGLLFNSFAIVLDTIHKLGIQQFFANIQNLLLINGNNLTSRMTFHRSIFAIGLAFVFIGFDKKKSFGRIATTVILAATFFLGYKRSALISILMVALYFFFTRHMGNRKIKKINLIIAVMMIFVSLLVIWLCISGTLDALVDTAGIKKTSARRELIHYVDGDYSLSPFFMGHGKGYVGNKMKKMHEVGISLMGTTDERTLHNDILTDYVELGMIGFFVNSIFLYLIIGKTITDIDPNSGRLWAAMMIYYFMVRCINPVEGLATYPIMIMFVMSTLFDISPKREYS